MSLTEMPKTERRNYPLVTADHLAGRVFPLTVPMAGSVIEAVLEQIEPRFGLVENVDSGVMGVLLPLRCHRD